MYVSHSSGIFQLTVLSLYNGFNGLLKYMCICEKHFMHTEIQCDISYTCNDLGIYWKLVNDVKVLLNIETLRYLKTMNGLMSTVVHNSSNVPARRLYHFTTSHNGEAHTPVPTHIPSCTTSGLVHLHTILMFNMYGWFHWEVRGWDHYDMDQLILTIMIRDPRGSCPWLVSKRTRDPKPLYF